MRLDTHRLQTLDQGSGVPRRKRGARPATATPRRRLRVRGQDPATVRLRPAREDRQGPAAPLSGQGDRSVPGAGTRLLRQHRTTGRITDRRGAPNRPFARRYARADVGLPAETDAPHGKLSGPATRALCARALHLFGDSRFERLARISNGHLYNLRHSTTCARRRGATPQPTRPVQVSIGERRRPQPFGRPGWVRVDTVHQGDLDGIKTRQDAARAPARIRMFPRASRRFAVQPADVRVFRGTLLLTMCTRPGPPPRRQTSPRTAPGAGAVAVHRCDERYSRGRTARNAARAEPLSTHRFGRLTGSAQRPASGSF